MFALKHGQGRSAALAGRSAAQSDAEVGRGIRELRRSRGWTLKTLAGMIGVTGAQLHRYETGTTRMTGDRLTSLGEALGVDVGSLLGKADESTVTRPMSREPAKLSDDILALVEVFVEIADPKSRSAIVAIARILASPRTIPEID